MEETDPDTHQFISTFLSRYVSRGRPLSGYFLVCCIIETEWTILAQALAPPQTPNFSNVTEAAAANRAWNSLMRNAALEIDITDEETISVLKATIVYTMQCFTDLLVQIEDMDAEPSIDTYTWETMSESLVIIIIPPGYTALTSCVQKLASICTVALRDLDEKLYSRLLLLLSDDTPISDNLVQESALKATTILVRR